MCKQILLIFVIAVCCANISAMASEAPSVSAQSAVVIENSTGKVIYEKNARQKLPMASTTKIMTALCAIENSNPDKLIEVNSAAVGIEGSSIYLAHDEKITIRNLLYGTMLNSGNDAATALAYEVSGSVENFAALMNKTAQKIGAKDTNFINACGLYADGHYTTAFDLASISAYALSNPLFAEIASCREMKITNGDKGYPRVLKNHNKLLSMYDGCIGVKTGYTKKCGRCLVSAAMRDGITLTCVTLNAPDDWNDHIKMLDYGFSKTSLKTVVNAGDYCMSTETEKATEPFVKLYFESGLSYAQISGSQDDTGLVFEIDTKVKPGTKKGDSVGIAKLVSGDKEVASSRLLCGDEVFPIPQKSFAEGVGDLVKLWLGQNR